MEETSEALKNKVEVARELGGPAQEDVAELKGFAADYGEQERDTEEMLANAPVDRVISSILKEMSQDATTLKNMLAKELADLRRILSYDAAIKARLLQLFPSLDLENVLEAMKAVVTKKISALQTLLGGAQNMPDSLI